MAKTAKTINGDDTELIHEIDSVEVGGYPTSILYFAIYMDNDTIIQKQFVTDFQDSHIVIFFNENFYIQNLEDVLELEIYPLKNDSVLKKSMEEETENHPVDENFLNNATRLIEQYSRIIQLLSSSIS